MLRSRGKVATVVDAVGFGRWLQALALCAILSPVLLASAEIDGGVFKVGVNAHGLLTAVPEGGLRTVDGPRVELSDGFAEWFGVRYRTGSDRVESVGVGRVPDWADREPVETVQFRSDGKTATSVTRAGDLEILSELAFDDSGAHLLLRVTLTNRSDRTLEGIVYSREWRRPGVSGWTFPDDIDKLGPAAEGVRRHAGSHGDVDRAPLR